MASKSPLKVVLGMGNVGDKSADTMARYDTRQEVDEFLQAFLKRGYNQIDTARAYSPGAPGTSEPRLGAVEAGKEFVIDTKVKSQGEGIHKKEGIEKSIEESIDALKIPQVNIEYLHAPDRTTPFEETCEAMDAAYREGKFKQFGLSNYTAEEVESIIEICERRGFVKPTVYQGQYNPIVRSGEKDLFPVLRKHGIAFYAWSPGAGGFFAGNYKDPKSGSRFDQSHRMGGIFAAMYTKPGIIAATDKALEAVAKHGINGHAASLRWVAFHSVLTKKYEDAVIIGASSVSQLNTNIDCIEQGPLPDEVVKSMEALHKQIDEGDIAYHF